ncbi:hypothetical protein CFC21_049088 [Triticum aestivum]|uniref:Uncharacterized protein n=3 Tax=Triticinae TaxID=1648030 RepID=A0A453G520_AEGTS|nr:uncharacterized protein LOC109767945 [Aegilops tauschii subsp. strangulata]XP_044353719.1 uncharacterized protein LOC123075108 [Triticum aestivum]KAF7039006.1 hypothetical protein CFC21_049088 [Triticum aestivum]
MATISSTSYFSSQPQLPASDGANPATTRSSSSNGRQPRRRRTGRCVMLEVDAASGSGSGGAAVGRTRSLTEEDLEELKACLDLGFGFSYHEIPGLRGTLPGLELCYSMTRRFLDEQRTLVGQLEPAAAAAATPIPDWRISGPGDDPDEVKARLRYWAQTVACTVKLCT